MALLMVVLWAYAQTIFVSFGVDISDYKTVTNPFVNTFKAMIEGYDIDELRSLRMRGRSRRGNGRSSVVLELGVGDVVGSRCRAVLAVGCRVIRST